MGFKYEKIPKEREALFHYWGERDINDWVVDYDRHIYMVWENNAPRHELDSPTEYTLVTREGTVFFDGETRYAGKIKWVTWVTNLKISENLNEEEVKALVTEAVTASHKVGPEQTWLPGDVIFLSDEEIRAEQAKRDKELEEFRKNNWQKLRAMKNNRMVNHGISGDICRKNDANGTQYEVVNFGYYPQSADGQDMTPIEWRILERTQSELLLISEKILDVAPYHNAAENVTWQDCTLRHWLNNDFYNKAFNDAEKAFILPFESKGNGAYEFVWTENGKLGADKVLQPSPDTMDNVFLLSIDEIKKHRYCMEAKATDFAIKNGLEVEDGSCGEHGRCYDPRIVGNGKWWLRNRERDGFTASAAYVYSDSPDISTFGGNITFAKGVRPCIRTRIHGLPNG